MLPNPCFARHNILRNRLLLPANARIGSITPLIPSNTDSFLFALLPRCWKTSRTSSLPSLTPRSSSRATLNTAASKPIVNHPRTKTNAFKRGYSQSSRPFNRHFANKNSIINTNVNTARVKHTTARDRAVVSENKGKGANVVKASACWVWKAKNSSASTTFKKYSYIDARGRSKSIMAWIPKRV
ncbi:hypothetical protein Tco_0257822 [Tanacetum coccineum]